MLKYIQVLLISLPIFFVTTTASAFRLDPMVMNFQVSGDQSNRTFRVENEGKEKIAVKIQAFSRDMAEDGKEIREPSTHFKVFPEQFSLNEKDSRVVRVIYTGPKEIAHEMSYRLVATQLPVSFQEGAAQRSGIKFLFEYVASVYVTQDKFFPQIVVESVKPAGKGQQQIRIVNRGTRHKLLREVKITLQDSSGKKFVVDASTVPDWDSENILAGASRVFSFKSEMKFDLEKQKAIVELKDAE